MRPLLFHGKPVGGTPPHNLVGKASVLGSRHRLLCKAWAWLDSRIRADRARGWCAPPSPPCEFSRMDPPMRRIPYAPRPQASSLDMCLRMSRLIRCLDKTVRAHVGTLRMGGRRGYRKGRRKGRRLRSFRRDPFGTDPKVRGNSDGDGWRCSPWGIESPTSEISLQTRIRKGACAA